jgi:hypothetical protein
MNDEPPPLRSHAVESEAELIRDLLIGLAIILAVVLIILLVIINETNESKNLLELSKYGTWAQGKVISRSTSGGEHPHAVFTYQFSALEADGTQQIYQGETSESGYTIGTPVTVIYSSYLPGLSLTKTEFTNIQDQSIVLSIFGRYSLIFQLLVIGAGLLCAAFLFNGFLPGWRLAKAVTREGICTSGTVVNLSDVVTIGNKGRENHEYYAVCEYQVIGQNYGLRERISKSSYEGLVTGSRVKVRYLPDRPKAARLEE